MNEKIKGEKDDAEIEKNKIFNKEEELKKFTDFVKTETEKLNAKTAKTKEEQALIDE